MASRTRASSPLTLCFIAVLFVMSRFIDVVSDDPLATECANNFQKVTTCLTYSTGKAETPTKECCDSVTQIRASKPVCLCYIILQIHKGSNSQLRNLGVQEGRLLRLPSACRLANASVSDCPSLLQIPPTSPDYAIFKNISTTPTPSAGTSSPVTTNGSSGFKYGRKVSGPMAIAMTIFFYTFAAGVGLHISH